MHYGYSLYFSLITNMATTTVLLSLTFLLESIKCIWWKGTVGLWNDLAPLPCPSVHDEVALHAPHLPVANGPMVPEIGCYGGLALYWVRLHNLVQ